jgi:hypothetical protein
MSSSPHVGGIKRRCIQCRCISRFGLRSRLWLGGPPLESRKLLLQPLGATPQCQNFRESEHGKRAQHSPEGSARFTRERGAE